MMNLTLKAPLVELCRAHLGPRIRWTSCAHDHAESEVWRVRSESGSEAFLKVHRSAAKHRRERDAYQSLLPELPPELRRPRLLASRDAPPRALLLEALPGTPLVNQDPGPAEERAAFEQAGRWLAGLHSVPCEQRDPMPLEEALERRWSGWRRRAHGHLPAASLAALDERLQPEVFRGATRVHCHRDYQPRNWLWEGGALAVIDFEHARPDCAWADVVKLAPDFRRDPGLEVAFFRGYGGRPGVAARAQLEQLGLLHALATATWAAEHDDAVFIAEGEALLRAALQGS